MQQSMQIRHITIIGIITIIFLSLCLFTITTTTHATQIPSFTIDDDIDLLITPERMGKFVPLKKRKEDSSTSSFRDIPNNNNNNNKANNDDDLDINSNANNTNPKQSTNKPSTPSTINTDTKNHKNENPTPNNSNHFDQFSSLQSRFDPTTFPYDSTDADNNVMSIQQESQTQFLALRLLPTNRDTLKTIFHGRIRCKTRSEHGTEIQICSRGLAMRGRWPGYSSAEVRSFMIQIFSPEPRMIHTPTYQKNGHNIWISLFPDDITMAELARQQNDKKEKEEDEKKKKKNEMNDTGVEEQLSPHDDLYRGGGGDDDDESRIFSTLQDESDKTPSTDPVFTELFIIGEIQWEQDTLPDTGFIFSFDLLDSSTSRGSISATIPAFSEIRPIGDSTKISFLGSHTHYEQQRDHYPNQVKFQYWMKSIPTTYSTVFIQQFGFATPMLNIDAYAVLPTELSNIECIFNGLGTVEIRPVYLPGAVPFLLGFTATARNPRSSEPYIFPAHTDLTLQCVGFKQAAALNHTADISVGAVGIQVDVIPMSFSGHDMATLDRKKIDFWYAEIINHPPVSSGGGGGTPIPPTPEEISHAERFGFFALNDTNTPLYDVTPSSSMTWSGATKQPMTNGSRCVSQYSRWFKIYFITGYEDDEEDEGDGDGGDGGDGGDDGADPAETIHLKRRRSRSKQPPVIPPIPVQIFLGAVQGAKFIAGGWHVVFWDSDGYVSIVDAGHLEPPDTYEVNDLSFQPTTLNGICWKPVEAGEFEVLFTIVLECQQLSREQPSSLVVIYDQLDVRSIDSHGTKYRYVHSAAHSPRSVLSNTKMGFLMNRVNLTSDATHAIRDLASYQYRYTFRIRLTHLPQSAPLDPSEIDGFKISAMINPEWGPLLSQQKPGSTTSISSFSSLSTFFSSFFSSFFEPHLDQQHEQNHQQPQLDSAVHVDALDLDNEVDNIIATTLNNITQDNDDLALTSQQSNFKPSPSHRLRKPTLRLTANREPVQNSTKNKRNGGGQKNSKNSKPFTPTSTHKFTPMDDPESRVFQWADFGFLSEDFVFTGDFQECYINDVIVNPVTLDEFHNPHPVEPDSTLDTILFHYNWEAPIDPSSITPRKEPIYDIYCNDVYLVNATAIKFSQFIPPDRPTSWNWPPINPNPDDDTPPEPLPPTNPLIINDPTPLGVRAFFSYQPKPSQNYDWYVVGSLAEFDPVKYDLLEFPSYVLTFFMATLGGTLLGIWVYSGTQHAANNAVHRSKRR